MFENLVNLFNQQSTFIQVVVVAIVAYVIYLVYLELTKEKFSGNLIIPRRCFPQELGNLNYQKNFKKFNEKTGVDNKYKYKFKDSPDIETTDNLNLSKGAVYLILDNKIICRR
jgi:hypothetical protein